METLKLPSPIADVSTLDRLDIGLGGSESSLPWTFLRPLQERQDDLRKMVAEQGTTPLRRIEDLKSDLWPDDESVDEFIAAVRAWRNQG